MPKPTPQDIERRQQLPNVMSDKQLQRRALARLRHNLASLSQDMYEEAVRWLELIEITDGPRAAFDSYMKLLEFTVPKLSRAEVAVEDATEVRKAEMSMDELLEMVEAGRRANAGEKVFEGTVLDVTPAEDDFADLLGD